MEAQPLRPQRDTEPDGRPRDAAVQGPADPVAQVLGLQRSIGNAAVGRLLGREPITDIAVPSGMTEHRRLRHLRHAGTPFVRARGEDVTGVHVSDIRQGAVGDCFFLSPLMALARINPGRVARMVRGPVGQTRIGANVYEVSFPGGGTYRIDDRFVSDAEGDTVYAGYGDMSASGPELWVMLLEKAWAAERGGSYQDTHFGHASDAMRVLTDEDSTWHEVSSESEDEILEEIRDAIDDGRPVVCNTHQTLTAAMRQAARDAGYQSLVPAHSYNVSWSNLVRRTLDIANPHGRNHLMGCPIALFRQIFGWYLVADESVR